jgi:hypothetical protein
MMQNCQSSRRFEVATRAGHDVVKAPGLSVRLGLGEQRLLEISVIFQGMLVVQETVFSGAVRERVTLCK